MKRLPIKLLFLSHFLIISNQVTAQIIPDQSLPNNSQVTFSDETWIIEGGTVKGKNLFHSFQEFSLIKNNQAFFNNSSGITNIISRVTGNNLSSLDGLIRANQANLFFLNPQGIIFGPNVSLDLEGSFIGTTANNIEFSDGNQFSSNTLNSFVTIATPLGLNFENNSGIIRVEGKGHNLTTVGGIIPTIRTFSPIGLQIQPEKTFALLGNNLVFQGAVFTGGKKIELGSVQKGFLEFDSNFNFNYEKIDTFGDLQFSMRSLVDSSGINGGSVNLQGKRIDFRDGSGILIQQNGDLKGGDISIKARESFTISGTDPIARIPGALSLEVIGTGEGGKIIINSPQVKVIEGAFITTRSYGIGKAGDIIIEASNSLEILGSSPLISTIVSSIISTSFNLGNAGEINIETGKLIATDGGFIASLAWNLGDGGDITVKANTIQLIGIESTRLQSSFIGSSTLGMGKAGNLKINTSSLRLAEGARIDSSTGNSGAAGSILIEASDKVEVIGTVPNDQTPTQIISSTSILPEALRQAFLLPDIPIGEAGSLTIYTPIIKITNGGLVTVKNEGLGNAGILEINTNSLILNNFGQITASTEGGEGGNIVLQSKNLELQNNSLVSATVEGGSGNGGNIKINADTLLLLTNSNISADAVQGTGGNIQITAKGLFVSEDSMISATSELGLDGTIDFETNTDVDNLFNQTEINFTPETALTAYSCLDENRKPLQLEVELNKPSTNNTFAPKPLLNIESVDVTNSTSINTWKLGEPIVEGTVLEQTSDGWRLVAAKNHELNPNICY